MTRKLWYYFIYVKGYLTSMYYSHALKIKLAPRIQQRRLLQILKYAQMHVPFYSEKQLLGGVK